MRKSIFHFIVFFFLLFRFVYLCKMKSLTYENIFDSLELAPIPLSGSIFLTLCLQLDLTTLCFLCVFTVDFEITEFVKWKRKLLSSTYFDHSYLKYHLLTSLFHISASSKFPEILLLYKTIRNNNF